MSIVKAGLSFSIASVIVMLQFKSAKMISVTYLGIFWPMWIVFALFLGITFALFMIFLNRLVVKVIHDDASKEEIAGILWMFYISAQYTGNLYTGI